MVPLVRACAIVTVAILATFLPFFPGGHYPLAVPLSAMAWALGRAGLLLVPVGGLWLWVSTRPPSRLRHQSGWCGSRSARVSSSRW